MTVFEPPPHRHLYVRLGVTRDRGIGVFAIRAIPAGTNPFQGDNAEMVRVPVAEVAQIADPDIRAMYLDFCPVRDGAYLAPANFNLLTAGWYMNHGEDPNVSAGSGVAFVTRRDIAKGEELTTDYETFSDGAKRALMARSRV